MTIPILPDLRDRYELTTLETGMFRLKLKLPPVEAPQPLDIDMQQLTGLLPFVPHRRFRRLQVPEPAQARRPADSGHRRGSDTDHPGDLPNRSPLPPQSHNPIPRHLFGRLDRGRSRAPVRHGLFHSPSTEPFPPSPLTHTGGLRRLAHRPSLFADSSAQQLST